MSHDTYASRNVPCGRFKNVLVTFEEFGELYQVIPIFSGSPRICTFEIVGGQWSYNKDDFTISAGGILSMTAPIGELRAKYVRVRIADPLTGDYADQLFKVKAGMAAAGTINGVPYDTSLPNVLP